MSLNNVPLSGQSLDATRNQINQNFSVINTAFSINHVAYNDASGGQGKHNLVTFPVQTSAPSFLAGEDGLYNLLFNNGTTSKNELFVHKQTNSATQDIPFTSSILSQNAAPLALTSGWSYLPSGILLKWSSNQVANGQTMITFPANAPAFTICMTVIVQVADGGSGDVNRAIRLTGVNPTNFSVYGSPRTTTGAASMNFTYLAIGY